MRVFGADVSSVATGWAVVDDGGKVVAAGTIKPALISSIDKEISQSKAKSLLDEQDVLRIITENLVEVIKKYEVDRIVVEDCFLGKNVRTLQLLARLSGAVLWAWLKEGRPKAIIISASSARKWCGVKGTAQKSEVVAFVEYKYGVKVENDNEADAIVLAMCGWLQYSEQRGSQARRGRKHGR